MQQASNQVFQHVDDLLEVAERAVELRGKDNQIVVWAPSRKKQIKDISGGVQTLFYFILPLQ